MKQRQLHRCKAIHKANITLRDLLAEWKRTAAPSSSSANVKQAKSDSCITDNYEHNNTLQEGVIKHFNNNALSKSLHEFPSNSLVHVHYIDSKVAQFERDSLAMRSANHEISASGCF